MYLDGVTTYDVTCAQATPVAQRAVVGRAPAGPMRHMSGLKGLDVKRRSEVFTRCANLAVQTSKLHRHVRALFRRLR